MGQRLVEIIERLQRESTGLPAIDLARLNLRVGKPLSRFAATLPDDPELIEEANKVVDAILTEGREANK